MQPFDWSTSTRISTRNLSLSHAHGCTGRAQPTWATTSRAEHTRDKRLLPTIAQVSSPTLSYREVDLTFTSEPNATHTQLNFFRLIRSDWHGNQLLMMIWINEQQRTCCNLKYLVTNITNGHSRYFGGQDHTLYCAWARHSNKAHYSSKEPSFSRLRL